MRIFEETEIHGRRQADESGASSPPESLCPRIVYDSADIPFWNEGNGENLLVFLIHSSITREAMIQFFIKRRKGGKHEKQG